MSEFNDWNRKIIDEFRANGGKVDGMLGRQAGRMLLLLHTKGAKSQQQRINPVTYVRDGESFVVIAGLRKSGFAPTNPDWYYNIVANPELTVEVGKETFRVHATVTEEPERTRLYNKMVQMMPTFDDHRRKTNRKIPVILLTPQRRIKPTALLYEVRKSVSEILNKPFTECIDHQLFKPDQKILALWAADCAERVLPHFEDKRPNDYRPRKAIEVLREWVKTGVFSMSIIRKASLDAHAAAKEVKDDYAKYAAHAAGQAVGTAHVPTHALGSSIYGIRAVAAYSGNVDRSMFRVEVSPFEIPGFACSDSGLLDQLQDCRDLSATACD